MIERQHDADERDKTTQRQMDRHIDRQTEKQSGQSVTVVVVVELIFHSIHCSPTTQMIN